MRILLLEPFMGESHKAWAEGYAANSNHEVEILSLPGRHWKWRMHGAAETFAIEINKRELMPDLILASDMLDLAGFLALTRRKTAHIPTALYFHENQLAYPWSPDDPDPKLKRDNHYAYINYRSALIADKVFFNSQYNLDSFLVALHAFLKAFPDHQELKNVKRIRKKASVLHLGMDLTAFDDHKPATKIQNEKPLIVWNHRWEYDKSPERFFKTLFDLSEEGIQFQLAILGRQYRKIPPIFDEAFFRLEKHIVHWGFAESFADYAKWLWKADILPVTAKQEFFGASVVEAMYCGCIPLLPNALAYPGHIPEEFKKELLHTFESDFKRKLKLQLTGESKNSAQPQEWVKKYDWSILASEYDRQLEELWQLR